MSPEASVGRYKRCIYKPARLARFRGETMNIKDVILKRIQRQARAEAGRLAGEFARAASEEKEAILAALEFEQWLAEACQEAEVASPKA